MLRKELGMGDANLIGCWQLMSFPMVVFAHAPCMSMGSTYPCLGRVLGSGEFAVQAAGTPCMQAVAARLVGGDSVYGAMDVIASSMYISNSFRFPCGQFFRL